MVEAEMNRKQKLSKNYVKTPKTMGDLRKLLGFLGYYRQSIENFSQKTKPIYDILSLPSENVSKSNHKLKKRRDKNLQVNLFYGQKTTQISFLSL